MPKLTIDVKDEFHEGLKKFSTLLNKPVEELASQLLSEAFRTSILDQIMKNNPSSTSNPIIFSAPSNPTSNILSTTTDQLFYQALELKKQELLLKMFSTTTSERASSSPELEFLRREIEALKEMNKNLQDQLFKKQEENKIDRLVKLTVKVVKSNQDVIEKLTKPKEGELPADVKKLIDDLNKQNAELKDKLKELVEAQKDKALITAMKSSLRKVGDVIAYTFETKMKELREDLKKVTESGGKVDVDKLLNTVTNTYKQITTSAIESLTSTKKLLETLGPTQPSTSTSEVITHVADKVKETVKDVVGEVRKTAEALNQEATVATPTTPPVIALPTTQPQEEKQPESQPQEEAQLPQQEQETQEAQSQ